MTRKSQTLIQRQKQIWMKTKIPKHPISGWLALDKPLGITSSQAVGVLRRVFCPQKIGHGGTLDPLATGILPIAMGEATKTVPYLMDATKDYDFSIRWGAETDTDDTEGKVTVTSDYRPDVQDINNVLDQFRGRIMQVPPKYSAIKLEGQRAYDLARQNKEVELASRPIDIHALEMLSHDGNETRFLATTGKGAYSRSLGRDIARTLGGAAHISTLRRSRVGPFDEKKAISLDFLEGITHSAALMKTLLPLESALDDIPGLILSDDEAERLQRGQQIDVISMPDNQTRLGTYQGVPVALIRCEQGKGQPIRVFNLMNEATIQTKEMDDVDYKEPKG